MDLLADQQAGKGGEIQLTDAMARSLDREAMYAVVIDRCRATIPVPRLAGWPPTPSCCKRSSLCRRLLGCHRRARRFDA